MVGLSGKIDPYSLSHFRCQSRLPVRTVLVPRMPDNQWNRVVEIFESANSLPDDERDQWVRAQCGDDQVSYDEVRSLLDAARAESRAAAGTTPVPSVEGRRYGPWQAERVLGTGGMGSVLLVRRADVPDSRFAVLGSHPPLQPCG